MTTESEVSFRELALPDAVLESLTRLGYERPSPIQAACIPALLDGRDIIGQAQTGTGKTAAFALPLLSRVDVDNLNPQVLVLAPTRELAIQVAEAFKSYASGIKGFHVLPIYGGQSYDIQLRQLKRGVHVVVGTPGRVMDHINRKTLKLDQLQALVLDEADEMLRMGFIDDVEWILERTPEQRQIALFSATMPAMIKKVAQKYLRNPEHIQIKSRTKTAATIEQKFVTVKGHQKLDAMTRLLEVADFDAALVFVRTKTATVQLMEKLEARGYACEALNGDIPQKSRERTIDRLKKGKIDIVIATDVAARGLDVDRIELVINYDIPYDAESYVHRIGRTGRAGRAGRAILFVTPKERHLLRSIERMTQQKIEPLMLPSNQEINEQRVGKFKRKVLDVLENRDLSSCLPVVSELVEETDADPMEIAAALMKMLQGDEPLRVSDSAPGAHAVPAREERFEERRPREPRREKPLELQPRPLKDYPDVAMQRYRLGVGYADGVKPGNIVGAIANEAELDSCYIGNIDIHDDFTLVDLPDGMPKEVMQILARARVAGRPLAIRPVRPDDSPETLSAADSRPSRSVSRDPSREERGFKGKPKGKKLKHKGKAKKGKRPAVALRKQQSRAGKAGKSAGV